MAALVAAFVGALVVSGDANVSRLAGGFWDMRIRRSWDGQMLCLLFDNIVDTG